MKARYTRLPSDADCQPFDSGDFDYFYSIYLGSSLVQQQAEQLRSVYDAGARVVLSSDFDVGSLSPFTNMEHALTLGSESLQDIDAAIRAYTINAPYLMRQ